MTYRTRRLPRKRPKTALAVYQKYAIGSSCDLRILSDRIRIDFTGPVGRFPSNYYSTGTRYTNGRKVPFVKKTPEAIQRFKLAEDLYNQKKLALKDRNIGFGIIPVYVHVMLANDPHLRDSHNQAKFVGDWLELIGLIDNDRYAQICCFKRSDYPEVKQCQTTSITIMPLDRIRTVFQKVNNYVEKETNDGRIDITS